MRSSSLSEELESITKDYDFGIVPGSAAIFVKDEENYIGRLDLTILEGILVIIEVDDQGYKVRFIPLVLLIVWLAICVRNCYLLNI
jgi:hypothetical protein